MRCAGRRAPPASRGLLPGGGARSARRARVAAPIRWGALGGAFRRYAALVLECRPNLPRSAALQAGTGWPWSGGVPAHRTLARRCLHRAGAQGGEAMIMWSQLAAEQTVGQTIVFCGLPHGAQGGEAMIMWSQLAAEQTVGQTIVFCGLPNCVVSFESGTGPRPLLFRAHQSRFDGVALDITDYVRQLSRRANPVIVGLILPKGISTAPQHSIGNPAGPALQPAHLVAQASACGWLPHCVNVVRHDRPGVKVVRVADCTVLDSVLDNFGDAGIPQPEGPRIGWVEPLVPHVKRSAAGVFGREDLGRRRRSGPGEPPRYEDNAAVREPMRKMPAIKKHGRPQKTMVCPTAKTRTGKQL